MRAAFSLICLLMLVLSPARGEERPRHVQATLIAEQTAVVPGSTLMLALRQIIDPGWHTYWVNPGDAGEPTHIDWHLPNGFEAGPIQWPAPRRLPVGPLMSFGFIDRTTMLTPVTVPKDLKPGGSVTLKGQASWLVCADICVPESADLVITLPVSAGASQPDPLFASDFLMAREALPHAFTGKAAVTYPHGTVRLTLTGGDLPSNVTDAAFFPEGKAVIKNAAPQRLTTEPGALMLSAPAGRGANPGAALEGVLTISDTNGTQALAIKAEPGSAAPADAALTLPAALLLALLGGLVLNLMPCVFPVLSMKALMVAQHAQDHRREALTQGLLYGLGVVASFLAVGGLLLVLRAAGAEVGWGFQFQSPLTVALLALLFLAISLNLIGVYEVSFLQSAGSGKNRGAFLSGILAVLAASPCTAPFMSTAIGFGLAAPPPHTLAVFAGLGIGMAIPFVLISASPLLLKWFPKPGPWMAKLKSWLAVPMALTCLWLIWVLGRQTGPTGLFLAGLAGAGLMLGLWALGAHQRGRLKGPALAGTGFAILLAALVLIEGLPMRPPGHDESGLPGEAYSPARLATLRQAGQPVFVNLTAAWCITCQYNEAVALSSASMAREFAARNIAYLKADWTLRDPDITRLLEAYGRNGVPLYLYFPPGAARAKILPQLLTERAVLDVVSEGG